MALETEKHLAELADRLTKSADAIHARLMKEIKAKRIDLETAQLLFQDEVVLRQRANALYTDAANCVVAGLPESQRGLLAVVEAANERIQKLRTVAQFVDLIADLLVLASAAYAAKPGPIASALQEVKQDVDSLREG